MPITPALALAAATAVMSGGDEGGGEGGGGEGGGEGGGGEGGVQQICTRNIWRWKLGVVITGSWAAPKAALVASGEFHSTRSLSMSCRTSIGVGTTTSTMTFTEGTARRTAGEGRQRKCGGGQPRAQAAKRLRRPSGERMVGLVGLASQRGRGPRAWVQRASAVGSAWAVLRQRLGGGRGTCTCTEWAHHATRSWALARARWVAARRPAP
jgi:hypothetical protein